MKDNLPGQDSKISSYECRPGMNSPHVQRTLEQQRTSSPCGVIISLGQRHMRTISSDGHLILEPEPNSPVSSPPLENLQPRGSKDHLDKEQRYPVEPLQHMAQNFAQMAHARSPENGHKSPERKCHEQHYIQVPNGNAAHVIYANNNHEMKVEVPDVAETSMNVAIEESQRYASGVGSVFRERIFLRPEILFLFMKI